MNKTIGIFLFLISGFILSVFAQEQKPNIILILADDLGYADLSLTESNQIQTPNIDGIAHKGVQFTQGYVSAPVCSPSRAGLLTGKNQVTFGYDNNLAENQPGFDPAFAGLPVEQKTIADRLKEAGYATGLVGKWHLGSQEQFHPLNRGFDEFWGYLGGGHHYFKSEVAGKGYLAPLISNYKEPQAITYLTDDKGDECVDFIRRHRDELFFLFASFNAPHSPLQATEADLALFANIEDSDRRTYLAMVHRLDQNVGKILNALQSEGLEENTIVVFLSDNGGPVDSNASLNAPFNGQKGILLEGGLRVPFLMKWPAKIPANSQYDQAVTSLDLMPTFLKAAGIPVQNEQLDGENLLPYVLGDKSEAPHPSLKWRFTISAGILENNWKLIRLPDRLPLLFDLSIDPSELENLSLKHPEITQNLLKKLGDWDLALPHPLFLEGAEWKARQRDLYDRSYSLTQPKKN
ncbi:Arylsulfatase A [Algoriphagus faecimaris]|uniref:Arylsulfatase A n=1 Tax=Algoriphagus faecimaris TaxID=686796 RepID=A0A1G6SQM9_9BACT|nr:sulfatase-like hydrolase/transferase [Algoriphagus faecimaris]SDD18517.1 Arylsulfatase A [Algoriphagus faecimaris]